MLWSLIASKSKIMEKSRATLRASENKPAGTVSSELLKFLKEDSWTPEGAAISRP